MITVQGGEVVVQRNMSDIIEAYLKQFLSNQEHIEIKRSDIADYFDCVPSQINYVINTRFTREHGYVVESKRGGGGYIRILKIQLVDDVDQIDQMIELVGNHTNHRNGLTIIETLLEKEVITAREATLMSAAIDKTLLQSIASHEAQARAQLLQSWLYQLRYTRKRKG